MRLLAASLALAFAALSSGCILVPIDGPGPHYGRGYGYGPPPGAYYHHDDDRRWHRGGY